ncbi:hypothetical protein FT663_00329 [Candidozyma haemuli var. vulneris]|uniref:V-type ATPase assembly factor PKR1 n=1 Tax=Candidozyma haemuli TaxID=45357 RepID=A0A2V1ART6_9ASCO|nr:hypothetical protein CXQ85_002020 [[Candida] haemuloni]KAF3992982.1 hypothetical protein FT662_00805 [[Candida] haemuloni var. vulneris]KAF3995582.1 hypothetical protein FT663_00329 [[Candida] haemuloni var. vulneris]PVH20236.1 hypothetical protein CXQ85_002020 [[Candida] haemuloni]
MAFIVELWQSVFTPGTTPALMKALHATFILLFISLFWLIYVTGSIHYINLSVIALLLYGSVLWFVKELEQAKLKTNEELLQEGEEKKEGETESTKAEGSGVSSEKAAPVRKRKV